MTKSKAGFGSVFAIGEALCFPVMQATWTWPIF
jgi:hypothetical protein